VFYGYFPFKPSKNRIHSGNGANARSAHVVDATRARDIFAGCAAIKRGKVAEQYLLFSRKSKLENHTFLGPKSDILRLSE